MKFPRFWAHGEAGGGLFGSLFGKPAEPEDPAKAAMAKASAWAQAHPGWNWRVYRTKGVLRLLAMHALFDPADPVCERVFAAVEPDPLYRKLCQTQECFRARLTPKPWRAKIGHPPARWPFADAGEEQAFANWDSKYEAACRSKATCHLLDMGSGEVHADLRQIVNLHDETTRASWPGSWPSASLEVVRQTTGPTLPRAWSAGFRCLLNRPPTQRSYISCRLRFCCR